MFHTHSYLTGLFPDSCRAWKSRAIARKAWSQFKIDVAAAHCEFRLNNQTAHQSGFHSVNMMIEQGRVESIRGTVYAVAQLATATASDQDTVATLTTTNAKLETQLEAAHALITQLKNEIATLKNKIKPAWQGQRPVKTTNNTS
jgi:phage shock protein A